MDESLSRKRELPPPTINEFLDSAIGLKLLTDVLQKLNFEQIEIVKSIGFGSILKLSCSSIPHDVFNWIAAHMDSTSGCIELENGFSFIITRECVQIIMDLPLGSEAIPFSSSQESVESVNIEIHGKPCTPTVHQLADLIIGGLAGPTFAKAFMILLNYLLLCPANQCTPCSSYFHAISDVDRIKKLDWCSFVLCWLLLSVNKYQIDGYAGNCTGCGLIPVLGVSIPRLPLWTDNILKLYSILDSKEGYSFRNLPMKHLCCTPFAHTIKKPSVSYELPIDVVSFIENTYNTEDQKHFKKKLKFLSTNLHRTILSNATRTISTCVDEVLRAFCDEDQSISKEATLFFKESNSNYSDLLHGSLMCKIKQTEGPSFQVKDSINCTRQVLKDIIYDYMDRTCPPIPVVDLQDNIIPSSKVFAALVEELSKEHFPIDQDIQILEPADVDEFLRWSLVTKLEITRNDEDYRQMSMLVFSNFNLVPSPSPKMIEEKADCTGWFDCFEEEKFQDEHLSSARQDGISSQEHLLHQSKLLVSYAEEFPMWNFGEEFEDAKTPTTHVCTRSIPFNNSMPHSTSFYYESSSSKDERMSFHPRGLNYSSTMESEESSLHSSKKSNISISCKSNETAVVCSPAENELFIMLTTNIQSITQSYRIFQIDERWADERTMALCMSNGGYINEYVMNAFVKMILHDQEMNDKFGMKIGFIKHITFSEISELLMSPQLDHELNKKLFTKIKVGFKLEHAGLVHVPRIVDKQWFLVVANFMDKCFDVLNPSSNIDSLKSTIDAVVHNFRTLFAAAFPRCQNFNIKTFKVRHIQVPKQNWKYDSGFFVVLFMQTYNGSEADLPALKKSCYFSWLATITIKQDKQEN